VEKRRNGEDMSENHASFIKFLSAFLGAVGAAVCAVMAFVIASELLAKVLLLLLAAVFLLIVYPLYKIGSMMEELAEQNKKLSMLATRQAKLLKTVDSSGKYSPMA
jgi:membrane protein YdbS with pleckstrin-like domain